MIEQFMSVPYLAEGRTMEGADCWGLALLVREALGCRSYPQFPAVRWDRPRSNQAAYREVARHLAEGVPTVGAFACVLQPSGPLRDACLHVGVVVEIDSRLCVIETNVKGGVRWYTVEDFTRAYAKVVFLNDPSNLPERPEG